MEEKQNNSMELYKKGKEITEQIEEQSKVISGSDDKEKEIAREKIQSLNEEKDKLKEEIYKQAKEISGLDYSKEEKNPETLRKMYNEQLADIKKRKHELKLEKIKMEKLYEEKKSRIKQQFEIATEKYKAMFEAGKIAKELYESRIENMQSAMVKDKVNASDELFKITDQIDKANKEYNDITNKLETLESQERIYNEYGDVYYRLFGEVLSDRNKSEKTINEKTENRDNNTPNVKAIDETEENNTTIVNNVKKDSNIKDENVIEENNHAAAPVQEAISFEENEVGQQIEDIEEPDVIVTNKKTFNMLYKKMKKGSITDKELDALTEVLEDPKNYDKYGITTGIIFNKSKKILKYQGARKAQRIEKFLRQSGYFNDKIRFGSYRDDDNIVSHDTLKSWKDIDEKLTYTDAKFSFEKYIESIEKYKDSGKALTKDQERILNEALSIKKSLSSYRKALNINEDVTTNRIEKFHDSVFYKSFSNLFKDDEPRALPNAHEDINDPGFVVVPETFDLSSMVVNEPSEKEIESNEQSKEVKKDKNKDIQK